MKVHNTNDDLVVDFDDSISQTSETKTFKDDVDASASAAPAARAETKRRRQSVAAAHGLPNGVTHHFFLSHKKIHSQHGKVPAEIARSLKDSLELMGFVGWFDVDNLKVISKDALARGVSECATMIVLLNDETADSEWCRFEWETAAALKIPIKVVVDLERGNKQELLKRCLADYPALTSHQWLEYIERYRRDCIMEMCDFLHAEAVDDGASSVADSEEAALLSRGGGGDDDDDDAERGGGGAPSSSKRDAASRVFDPAFERLMLVAGVPLQFDARTPKWAPRWVAVSVAIRVWLGACALAMTVYTEGPAYTDPAAHVAFATMLWEPLLVHALIRPVLNGTTFSDALRLTKNGTGQELRREVTETTRWAAKEIYKQLPPVIVIVPLAVGHLYLRSWYLAHARPWPRVFGATVGVSFCVLPVQIVFSGLTLWGLFFVVLVVARIPCEAAFDSLHPQIAQLGLRRFFKVNKTGRLIVKKADLVAFQEKFNQAVERYLRLTASLWKLQLGVLALHAPSFLMPLSLAVREVDVAALEWPHHLRFVLINVISLQAVATYLVIAPFVCCTLPMRRLQRAASRIVAEDPAHTLVLRECIFRDDLTFRIGGVVGVTNPVVVGISGALVLSYLPWLWVKNVF